MHEPHPVQRFASTLAQSPFVVMAPVGQASSQNPQALHLLISISIIFLPIPSPAIPPAASAAAVTVTPGRCDRRLLRCIAFRTVLRLARCRLLGRYFPLLSIFCAAEAVLCHLEVAAIDPYRLAVYQGICDLSPRRGQHPLKSRTGDVHFFGALFLLQPLNVLQPYGLDLVYRYHDFIQLSKRDAGRFEVDRTGDMSYAAALNRSGQYIPLIKYEL